MVNGVNNWSVSFAQISWLQQLLITHGNVAKVTRRDDIVFEDPADYWDWQRAIEAKLKAKNFA